MHRLALLPLLMLVFACNDSTFLQPEEQLAAVAAVPATDRKIPFKGKNGNWWSGEHGLGCEGSDQNVWAVGPGEIHVTHLGRSEYSVFNCWTAAFEFVSQTGQVTAANGDQLFWYGSAEMGTVAVIDFVELTYVMGPFWFTGGTGRFEGATGHFSARGELAEDLQTGTENWDGVLVRADWDSD